MRASKTAVILGMEFFRVFELIWYLWNRNRLPILSPTLVSSLLLFNRPRELVRWTTPGLGGPGARGAGDAGTLAHPPHAAWAPAVYRLKHTPRPCLSRDESKTMRSARRARHTRCPRGAQGDPDTLAHPPHAACVPNAYPLVHTPRPRPPPPPRANEETVACTPSPAVCSVTAHMQRRRPRGPGRRTPKSCSPRQTRGSFASGAPGARMRDTRHPRVPRHAPLRGCDRLSVCVWQWGGG